MWFHCFSCRRLLHWTGLCYATGCHEGPEREAPLHTLHLYQHSYQEERLSCNNRLRPRVEGLRKSMSATKINNNWFFNNLKVIHRLSMPYAEDEIHHTGWNACSRYIACGLHACSNMILVINVWIWCYCIFTVYVLISHLLLIIIYS